MAKPKISQFLKRQDRLVWSRFLNSKEGQAGLSYLRIAFPVNKASNEAELIRNGVGFEYWQGCVAELLEIGDVPDKPENPDAHEQLEN